LDLLHSNYLIHQFTLSKSFIQPDDGLITTLKIFDFSSDKSPTDFGGQLLPIFVAVDDYFLKLIAVFQAKLEVI
jgi:hypothetical protein